MLLLRAYLVITVVLVIAKIVQFALTGGVRA